MGRKSENCYWQQDVLQLFDLCNLTSINDDMTILVNTIVTPFQGIIPVCCKKGNNSTVMCLFHLIRSALERSTRVDEIRVLYHQNPANIVEDAIILAIIIRAQVHHIILYVVTNAVT
jgi:hypothetical protein